MGLAFRQAAAEAPSASRDNDESLHRGRASRPGPRLRIVGGASALDLERRLLALSGRAARCRFVQGRLATQLLAKRGWRTLGFVRLSDYSRERLGVGARAIEEAARVAAALEPLPRMTAAFLDGTLSWTAVRLIAGVASARDEAQWIQRATNVDTRALEKLVRGTRRENSAPSSATDDDGRDGDDAHDAHDTDDPSVRWSVRVSRSGLRLWRAARELAERSAGCTLTQARVLELVAAEAASSVPARRSHHHPLDASNAAVLDRLRGFTDGGADAGAAATDRAAGDADAGATAAGYAADTPTECNDGTGTSTGCNEGAGASTNSCAAPGASAGPTAFDWREGLEARDPQLAAFLAAADREAAAGGACGDGATEVARESAPFDWREGLEERDPQLAAFLAQLESEEADGGTLKGGESADGDDEATPFAHRPLGEILAEIGASEGFAWLAAASEAGEEGPVAQLEAHLAQLEAADPFTVDARLREVRVVQQRVDRELASLLREAVDGRLYRDLGFKSLDSWVESRLGICQRTAWNLLAIERATTRRSPLLAEAWGDGRVSSMAARALLPVAGRGHDRAWILRAQTVTLRRLEAEVDWTLDRLDDDHSAEPPPVDFDLTDAPLAGLTLAQLQMRARPAPQGASGASPDPVEQLQMRAHPAAVAGADTPVAGDNRTTGKPEAAAAPEPVSVPFVQVTFFAPQSVVTLAAETMMALRIGSEPRGSAFERMLALAMLEWLAAPAHRDPVFARDGWRCAVPGCSSRRNLHDHHVVFRSHGGNNERDNRITVCAAHHLHGLHRGRIRAHGAAPHGIVWELGVRFGGGQPLSRLHGDRYLDAHRGAG